MKINTRTLLVELVTGIVAMAVANTAQATNLLVYNNNNSGAGSLRQAVSDNNALGGGNTIVFSNVVFGTITLTSGELLITKNATILGPGANVLAINGNAASRVFDITNTTVTISGLTITNGNEGGGGGIFNDGINGNAMLTVSNCTFSGNSGDDGGGIYNSGLNGNAMLTVGNCTFIGNSAFRGGGLANFGGTDNGTVLVIACTFSGNSAHNDGGGIVNNAIDGNATLSVIACTFSGNSASDGAGGIETLSNSGGDATLTIGDTILKAGASGANIENDDGGTATSQGYNLCSDNGGGVLTGVADLINTDPMLGPLQDNCGPTFTCAPLPGSPAIDQGKSFGLTTDQRGRPRTFDNAAIPNASLGDGTDIGAMEVYPPVTLIVSNVNDASTGSLRQAITDAAPLDTITFAAGVTGTITLSTGELLVDKRATILGPTTAHVIVSGNNTSRVFHMTTGAAAVIANLTIANGFVGGFSGGGGILNDLSTLTVSNCTLSGNSAYSGGGIYNNGESSSATLTILNSTIINNSASGNFGGGIYNDGNFSGSATLTILNSSFSSNSASSGIYNEGLVGSAMVEMGGTILNASGLSFDNNGSDNGTITSLGYNLSSDNGGGFLTGIGDQINTNPLLGPLADNGGPTFTMALRVGSPAIDKGKSFGFSTDQRGQPRPYDDPNVVNAAGGDGSDIGAYEAARLQITAAIKTGNNLQLSFTSLLGTNYEVQSQAGLATNGWVSLAGSTPGNGSIATTTISNAFSQSKEFYRIHPVP